MPWWLFGWFGGVTASERRLRRIRAVRAHAVVAFNAAEEWSQDGSEDIAHEVLDVAYDAE
jgi:hypothetical protein